MDADSQKLKIGELAEELFVLKEVTWKIPTNKIRLNFLVYDVQSAPFSFAGANWILHLYPYGCTGSNSVGCIKLEIERLESTIPQQCVRYKSYFITHQGKEFNPIRVTHTFNKKCKVGWLLHIQKDNFFLDEKIISTGDVLTLKCQMKTSYISANETFSEVNPVRSSGTAGNISRQVSLPTAASECKGRTGNVSRQVSLPFTPKYKESSPEISEKEPVNPSTSASKDFSPGIFEKESIISPTISSKGSSPEISEKKPKILSTSTIKGCDCGTQHSTLFPDNKMLRDFKDLFLKQEDCDVIMNVKGREFPAHRSILRARSPVFASTFSNDMKEKATGIVNIEDCDPSTFSDFLCFLYCGNTENITMDNVFSLFTSADKYDVQDLRSQCLEFLKDNLSVDTFCDTIALAIQYLEKELIEFASDFFAKHFQEIIVTVKWQTFVVENPIQSNEIMIKSFVSDTK